MGEHTETFTIDGYWTDVKEICIRHLKGFGYKLIKENGGVASFERGSIRKNLFTFSFEEAYKRVDVSIVGNEEAPVSTVSISFSLPFLQLRKHDIDMIRSTVKALRQFVAVTLGYGRTTPRARS